MARPRLIAKAKAAGKPMQVHMPARATLNKFANFNLQSASRYLSYLSDARKTYYSHCNSVMHSSGCVRKQEVVEVTAQFISQANSAYNKQVSDQVQRITGELARLETLLSAGMVDRRVLYEFRMAVDRVRQTGWQVQRWLDGDEDALAVMLTQQRIRSATKMARQLAAEPVLAEEHSDELTELRQAIDKLQMVLPPTN